MCTACCCAEVPAENLVGDILESLRAPFLFVDTGGLALYREDGADEAAQARALKSGVTLHQ